MTTEAYGILSAAADSKKGGIRVSADPLTLAKIFNALRRERTKHHASFGHLVFKRKRDYVDVLNSQNIIAGLEEVFPSKEEK